MAFQIILIAPMMPLNTHTAKDLIAFQIMDKAPRMPFHTHEANEAIPPQITDSSWDRPFHTQDQNACSPFSAHSTTNCTAAIPSLTTSTIRPQALRIVWLIGPFQNVVQIPPIQLSAALMPSTMAFHTPARKSTTAFHAETVAEDTAFHADTTAPLTIFQSATKKLAIQPAKVFKASQTIRTPLVMYTIAAMKPEMTAITATMAAMSGPTSATTNTPMMIAATIASHFTTCARMLRNGLSSSLFLFHHSEALLIAGMTTLSMTQPTNSKALLRMSPMIRPASLIFGNILSKNICEN